MTARAALLAVCMVALAVALAAILTAGPARAPRQPVTPLTVAPAVTWRP